MIFAKYADFRSGFALVGAPLVADGFPEWPYAKLDTGGFSGALEIAITGFPFTVTCNAGAADASPGVDDYDWYVSQRTDTAAIQYLLISASTANHSGTISIDVVAANLASLLPGLIVTTGTAQAGAANTITLATGASSVNDEYNDMRVVITDGTGSGQERLITDYVGSTRVATVASAWTTTPDATSVYQIVDATDLSVADIKLLFRDVALYVQRRSDKSYRWSSVLGGIS